MSLERFIPLSPDPNITTSSDMGMAQFGHLNTIVDYLNGTKALTDLKIDGTLFFNSYSGGAASIIITHSGYNQDPLNYIGGGATLIVGGYYSQYLSTPYNQGYGNTVLGIYASIVAHDNSYFNTVVGYGASVTINEPGNIVIGYGATSSTANATVIGRQTNVSGFNGSAIGYLARTTTTNGFALGNSSSLLQIGGNFVPTARVHIKGLGSTLATTSLLVQNSSGTEIFKVLDNGSTSCGLGFLIGSNQSISDGTFALNNQNLQSYNSFSIETVPQNRQIKLRPASVEVLAANYYLANGQIGVVVYDTGSYSHNASAVLQVNSTTRGFLKPKMTTAQKNAIVTPTAGLEIYDTDLNRPCYFNGTSWITV